jgi:hypothetical protein
MKCEGASFQGDESDMKSLCTRSRDVFASTASQVALTQLLRVTYG